MDRFTYRWWIKKARQMNRYTLTRDCLTLNVKAADCDDARLRPLLLDYLIKCGFTGSISASRTGKQRGSKSLHKVRVTQGSHCAFVKVEDTAENCYEYLVYPPTGMPFAKFMKMILAQDSRKRQGEQVPVVEKAAEKHTGRLEPQADTKVPVTVVETGTPTKIIANEGADPTKTDGAVPPTPIEAGTKKPFDLKEFFGDPEQMDVLVLSLKELFGERSFVPTSELTKFLVNLLQCEPNQMAPVYAKLARLPNGFHLEHDNHEGIQGYKAAYFDRERNPRKQPEAIGGNTDAPNVIISKLRELENQLRAGADEIHKLISSVETFGPSFERLAQLERVMQTLQGVLPK